MSLSRQFFIAFRKGFTEFDSPIVKANVGGKCLQSKLNKEKKKLQSRKKINILRRKGRRTVFIDDAKFNYTYNLG